MDPRVVMCLDMDAFFVSVERALHPELRGKPVVVGGHLEARGVVSSASYEARSYGVHSAMPLAQARRLCPHATFIRSHPEQYHLASRRVRAILEALSPWVEMVSIDEAFVDLTGTERALGAPLHIARQVQAKIRQDLDLPCTIGLAGNKVVAKVACEQAKPAGLRHVLPGQEAAFLSPLAVTTLPGVGPQTAARLADLRISTCGGLASAPLPLLERILGSYAFSLQRRARGEDTSPVSPESRPARSVGRSTTFDQDSRDLSFLRATLHLLAEQVGYTLRRHGLGSTCVAVQVRWADFTTRSHQRTLPHPIASDATLYRTADDLLEGLLGSGRQRVRLLGVQASHLSPLGLQLSLLPAEQVQERRAMHLSRCLDQIRKHYGFASIQRGSSLLLRDRLKELPEDGEPALQPP